MRNGTQWGGSGLLFSFKQPRQTYHPLAIESLRALVPLPGDTFISAWLQGHHHAVPWAYIQQCLVLNRVIWD
jgi:hypothetical protein